MRPPEMPPQAFATRIVPPSPSGGGKKGEPQLKGGKAEEKGMKKKPEKTRKKNREIKKKRGKKVEKKESK